MSPKLTLVACMMVVIAAGCAGVGVEPDPDTTAGSTLLSPLESTTTVPPADEAWLVVAIGDSTPAGFGVGAASAYPQAYADLLADDFGIEVEVANHATGQTRTVRDWVEIIETDEHLIADLAEARVVLIWMGWHDILPIVYLRTAASWPDPIRGELIEKNADLSDAWPRLITAVREAVPPGATILVADTGLPSPIVEEFGDEAFWPELKRLVFLDWRDVLIGAAGDGDAIVVPTWEAGSGPDGETDLHPEFGSDDGLHLNEAGQRFLAQLHRDHDGLSP